MAKKEETITDEAADNYIEVVKADAKMLKVDGNLES